MANTSEAAEQEEQQEEQQQERKKLRSMYPLNMKKGSVTPDQNHLLKNSEKMTIYLLSN